MRVSYSGKVVTPVQSSVSLIWIARNKTWGVPPAVATRNRAKVNLLRLWRKSQYRQFGKSGHHMKILAAEVPPINKVVSKPLRIYRKGNAPILGPGYEWRYNPHRVRRDYKGRFAGRF